jgi:Protein of unknown function (DUF1205)
VSSPARCWLRCPECHGSTTAGDRFGRLGWSRPTRAHCAAVDTLRTSTDGLGAAYRWLYLDPCPPSLQSSRIDDIQVAHPTRPWSQKPTGHEPLPDWLPRLEHRRTAYLTLGTIARIANDVELLTMALAALADRDLEVVVTLGVTGTPARLAPSAPTYTSNDSSPKRPCSLTARQRACRRRCWSSAGCLPAGRSGVGM